MHLKQKQCVIGSRMQSTIHVSITAKNHINCIDTYNIATQSTLPSHNTHSGHHEHQACTDRYTDHIKIEVSKGVYLSNHYIYLSCSIIFNSFRVKAKACYGHIVHNHETMIPLSETHAYVVQIIAYLYTTLLVQLFIHFYLQLLTMGN